MLDKTIKIETKRFLLRAVNADDATQNYLNWMKNAAAIKYIDVAHENYSMQALVSYINEKTNLKNCWFLAILEKNTHTHIGNIKFEPINLATKEAVMGVLIGDAGWRGKSVFQEVFQVCQKYLYDNFGIEIIKLGVDASNTAAIRAYEKAGFKKVETVTINRFQNIQMEAHYESIKEG